MSKERKTKGFLDSSQNRFIVIVLEVAVLVTLVVITCAVLRGNIIDTFQETTMYVLQSTTQGAETSGNKGDGLGDLSTFLQTEGQNQTQSQYDYNDYGYGNLFQGGFNQQPNNSNNNKLQNTSGWTTEEIINFAKSAVNKTKGYTKPLSVHHKESFEATVTECSGGSIVQRVVNVMVGWVVKPVDETLNYQNGYAQNSEGETVPIILPKKGSFDLSPSGVTGCSVRTAGNEYIVNINLVNESVGIGEVPIHNANSIGFLDVANYDISFMTVDRADISYTGSSIELHINSKGYVTYASYNVPLHIDGAAHRGSISGSAVFVGEQAEMWTLNY